MDEEEEGEEEGKGGGGGEAHTALGMAAISSAVRSSTSSSSGFSKELEGSMSKGNWKSRFETRGGRIMVRATRTLYSDAFFFFLHVASTSGMWITSESFSAGFSLLPLPLADFFFLSFGDFEVGDEAR